MIWTRIIRSRVVLVSGVDQAVVTCSGFLVSVIFARSLGGEMFGWYALLFAGFGLANTFQNAFVTVPLLSRDAALQGADLRSAHAGSHSAQWFVGGVCALAGFLTISVGAIFVEAIRAAWALPFAAWVWSYQMQEWHRRLCFASGRTGLGFLSDAVSYGLQIPILLLLWMNGTLSLESGFLVLASTSSAAYAAGVVRLNPGCAGLRRGVRYLKSSAGLAGGILYGTLFSWAAGYGSYWAAALVMSVESVGAVRIAVTMTGPINVLLAGIENFVPAEAARRYRIGPGEAFSYLKRAAFLLMAGLAAAALPIGVASPWILRTLFGAEYSEYAYLVPAALAALPAGVMSRISILWFRTRMDGAAVRRFYSIFAMGWSFCFCAMAVAAPGPLMLIFPMAVGQAAACVWAYRQAVTEKV